MGVRHLGRLFCAVPGDMAVPQEDTADSQLALWCGISCVQPV